MSMKTVTNNVLKLDIDLYYLATLSVSNGFLRVLPQEYNGLKYLQFSRSPAGKANPGYVKSLEKLYSASLNEYVTETEKIFGKLYFDLILHPPSVSHYYKPYYNAIVAKNNDATISVGTFEKTSCSAPVSHSANKKNFSFEPTPGITTNFTSLLIVDDVYSAGGTVAEMVSKMHDASFTFKRISVFVPLLVER